MKILAVGRNYAAHIEELNNEKPEAPVVFFKPDTAVLRNNEPFYYPEFSNDIHFEVEILLKIGKPGKHIQEKYASKYYNQIGIGIDFTARDLQQQAKNKGLPWALAKGFNNSAPISEFYPIDHFGDIHNLNFGLEIDRAVRQRGNTSKMLFSFNEIICYISRFITLKKGDIIFTGTPEGVGPVNIGNRLRAFIEDQTLLDFEVK
ncbi:MAG: FAA hydrolase family protein [Bacteroidetes bacterium]|nr:MAG: FAA hydrolase family protein [Bacteroidota bacterium]